MSDGTCSSCGETPSDYLRRGRCNDCYWRECRPKAPCASCGEATGYSLSAKVVAPQCRSCRSIWEHGTRAGYRRAKCRCDACRRWNREAQKDYAAAYAERTGRSLKRKYRSPVPRGSGWISQRDRFDIYERDGWVCQICDQPVNRDLHSNDDMAASLDHIVPRSASVTPDHSAENLRLAHRECNTLRFWAEKATSRGR